MDRFAVVMISLFVSLNGLWAADVYVNAAATGGKGTKAEPYKELWKAVDRAQRGDVIHVALGTYNAKGGSGNFTIKTPSLTLVGGYTKDFSSRDPFKNHTVLERAKDYRGGAMGLGEAIIQGKGGVDHSNLTVDGFVLNSFTRNVYAPNGNINPKGSWKGALFRANSRNVKLRNSILLNPYGNGIYCTWQGKENEVSNNFILNTFYCGVSTRSAQPDSVIKIANNTISFCWFQPGKGGSMCVFVGKQGQTIMENNIMAFANTEGGSGNAVSNTFANEDTILKSNTFFQLQGGVYKYMDDDNKNLLVWKPEDLEDLNAEAEDYMLLEAENNLLQNPKLLPDKEYFGKFANFIGSKPGKLNMDEMNQWRRALGLPLQAEAGTARSNWGMAYPLDKVVPNLVSALKNQGVQTKMSFQVYQSKAVEKLAVNYAAIDFDTFKKGTASSKAYKETAISFGGGMGAEKNSFVIKAAPASDYVCFQIMKPGKTAPTRDYIYAYLLKGSEAHKKWTKYYKKKDKYNKKGLKFKGRAFYIGNDTYSYPVGVIVDEVKR